MKPTLFIDRDGTLVEEPPDEQLDRLDKVRLMAGVVPALLRLRSAGYALVIVTNQDGVGSSSFPAEVFAATHVFLLTLLASQGIEFADVLVCPHLPSAGCACRKPKTRLIDEYVSREPIDREHSAVIGDRDSDMELAENLGLPGFRVALAGAEEETWSGIARRLTDRPRIAEVHRRTRETEVRVRVNLDAEAPVAVATGIGFLNHMIEQVARHGGFSLELTSTGDLEVDEHHTVEDSALALGQALRQALGSKRSIARYGFVLPMDEAEAQVALDLSGRAFLVFEGRFGREAVGGLPTELVPHFFRSLADSLGAALHLKVQGENAHHMIESCFKATGRSLRQAIRREGMGLPSTKGVL
ncbi:MAG: bifunctional histidinol-phosphatase/imidazoleglycerol-phosphate dehydratase HisB [Steroidobacteraceae bacterium]